MSLDAAALEKLLGLALERIRVLEEVTNAPPPPPPPPPPPDPSRPRSVELALDGDGEQRVRRTLNRIIVDMRLAALTLAKNRNRDLGARLTLDADTLEAIVAAIPKKPKP